jgi:phosphotriesterase-related protein
MHEHLVVGMPGWESDTRIPRPEFRDMVAKCVDRIQELQDGGYDTIIDPCPSDLGRNVDLFGEVAARTGFNIIFAAGLYNEHMGASPYWNIVRMSNPEPEKRLCDVLVNEIENGVGKTGLKPGILKVGTTTPPMTDYEKYVFRAVAMASKLTGVPITTHTDGVLGEEQLSCLMCEGVAPERVVIGHSCGNPDHHYHMNIIGKGAYLGFDRWGSKNFIPDETRIQSLLKIREKGALNRIVISHDSVCCWLGDMIPLSVWPDMHTANHPLRFKNVIEPMLKDAGVTAAEIDTMIVDNPRAYFSG